MRLSALCDKLPGDVLDRRIIKESIGLPERILFLLQPEPLRSGILYLLDSAAAGAILPGCTTLGSCGTVLCAGALPKNLSCQVNINLVSVRCGLPELYNAAAEYLAELQRSTSLEAERLQKRLASIIESNFPDDLQVEAVCATFPHRIRSSYCVICVESREKPETESNMAQLFGELAQLFPKDNLTTYDKDIIIIHSYDGFTHPPKLPMEELSELLRRHNACAGVSNGIRKISNMRMMYIMAKKTLEYSKVLGGRGKQNVYFYDEAMLFTIISMAADGFQAHYDTDDVILLCSPIVLNIIKHDPDGKRELLETLFQYIINGRSTTKTAEAMHMHRNTVQNRISLIEEITGEQFSRDGMLQAKLLTTYYAILYYTRVANKNLVLSPLKEGERPIIHRGPREKT